MKKIYKDEEIPVYEIYIEDGDATGIRFVSLVDKPAIELKGMAFNEQNKIKSFDFKADKDMQVIVGPAMVPGKRILRKDEDGNKYYVVFTKETIRQMVQKFNSQGTNRRINIDHSPKMASAYIMENWIVEDEYYDKSRKYGFEVPVGTWMLSVKVDDEKFWKDEVKDGGKYGFSVEGIMGQKPMSYKLQEISLNDYIDALTEDEIVNLFSAVNDDLVLDFFASTGQVIEEGMTFADEGDDFEPSKRVYVYALKPGVEGPFIKENSRPFCEYMHKINRFWTEDEINVLSTKLGYDFWQYFGSYNCRHTLKPVILTKNANPASASDMDTAVEKQAEAGLLGFADESCDWDRKDKMEAQFKCPPDGDGKNKDGSPDKRCPDNKNKGKENKKNETNAVPKEGEAYDMTKLNQEKAVNGTPLVNIFGPEYKRPDIKQANLDAGLRAERIDGVWKNVDDSKNREPYRRHHDASSPFDKTFEDRMGATSDRMLEEGSKIGYPLTAAQEKYLTTAANGRLSPKSSRKDLFGDPIGYETEEVNGVKTIYKVQNDHINTPSIKKQDADGTWYRIPGRITRGTKKKKTPIATIKNGKLYHSSNKDHHSELGNLMAGWDIYLK